MDIAVFLFDKGLDWAMRFYEDPFKFYNYLVNEIDDKRTKSWLLVRDPLPVLTIVHCYLLFVLIIGPWFMKNRKPFKLDQVVVVYNFLQIFLSTYTFLGMFLNTYASGYSLKCQPIDVSYNPKALKVAHFIHIYYLAKITELLDTVFFILRKKQNQVTFLHVYHHTGMVLVSWGATKYIPGGNTVFIGIINSFIHIIMYFYYMLSAMGKKYRQFLWWKKYITVIQMVQFGMTFLHNMQLLFYDCGYPRWVILITMPNAIIFYALFNDFYTKAYKKEANCEKNGTLKNALEMVHYKSF